MVIGFGGFSRGTSSQITSLVGCALFTTLAVIAARAAAAELARVSGSRFGDAQASLVGLFVTLAGYGLTASVLLVLLEVPLQRLLVSGAVTGVILGIAAQQSLANIVAGLVLLLNRPFRIGDEITIHSGALGGPLQGRVLGVGLTYVRLETEDGMLSLPNAGVLAGAVRLGTLPATDTGTPATGTPATGTPATGTPATGTAATADLPGSGATTAAGHHDAHCEHNPCAR